MMNGQLVVGATGIAGEFGHVSINEDGPLCNCGNRGCWEVYASNVAAVNYYYESLPGGNRKRKETRISFGQLLALARRGDEKAGAALDRMAHYLGAGIAMLASGFSPELVIGGGRGDGSVGAGRTDHHRDAETAQPGTGDTAPGTDGSCHAAAVKGGGRPGVAETFQRATDCLN